ncbi:60 kDa inner membrane insertion protein [Alkaliphilus metalliredigens QYMF]|uniref:60 kDa inner membrane insertion protein n=1 Tax=Alkaliphilus metalliredigens (strain QYMF) TaxID=293826 RepID=A6TXE7_ALKMQ|nr:YidC/Oxa1 family membrane protein insertase [Alkaliphilus metalliredigens]ABR50865.1 60 kDa inner membrane insertion protein [Alkaliphilus metalliredigens QYMF]
MRFFAQPLGALLKLIFDLIGNYGVSIIVFTILVKLLLLPLTLKQTRSMRQMQEVQPEIKKLQEKYKNDKEQLNAKTMEIYAKYNVSPFGGCLPLLVQFPILIGLFTALRDPATYVFGSAEIYASINTSFLWLSNLSDADPWVLPLLAGITTFLSSKTMSTGKQADQTQKMMTYGMPLMIFWWGRSFPAGLTLYWVVSNLFQFVQQLLMNRSQDKLKEGSN